MRAAANQAPALRVLAGAGRFTGSSAPSRRDRRQAGAGCHQPLPRRTLQSGRGRRRRSVPPGAQWQPLRRVCRDRLPPSDIDRNLLDVFCANIAVCAETTRLLGHLHDQAYLDRLVRLPTRSARSSRRLIGNWTRARPMAGPWR